MAATSIPDSAMSVDGDHTNKAQGGSGGNSLVEVNLLPNGATLNEGGGTTFNYFYAYGFTKSWASSVN